MRLSWASTRSTTAPIYGLGHSEEIVGKAISGNRDEYVISTKATFDWDTGVGRYWNDVDGHKVYVDHSYEGIKKDCENSLKRRAPTISTSTTRIIPRRTRACTRSRTPFARSWT